MHVLHVISGLDPRMGGPVTVVKGLSAAQARLGMRVSVAATFRNVTHEASLKQKNWLESRGIITHLIGPARDPMSRVRGMAAIADRIVASADVIHIHAMWEEIQHHFARACTRTGKPYFLAPHGMLSPWNLSRSPIVKRLYLLARGRTNLNRATAIHYGSEIERDLAKPLGLKAKTIVEGFGIDPAEFVPPVTKGAFRRAFPEIGDKPIILFMGRLNQKKGLDLLIPAFARVNFLDDTVLILAGPDEGGYGAQMKRLAAQCGIAGRTIFTGMLEGELRTQALFDADLFVLSSYQENFGIAVIESLAAGCPVVISDQVNIYPTIVQEQLGGVTAAEIDPLAKELATWMSHADRRAAAGKRGAEFVGKHWTWEKIALRWHEHYANV